MAGICSVGGDVMPLGTIPTPAVAFLTVQQQADAGIVISASHNPYAYNGIKVFNAQGYKLSDEMEGRVEDLILNHAELPAAVDGAAAAATTVCTPCTAPMCSICWAASTAT